jgi:hypothetical protein
LFLEYLDPAHPSRRGRAKWEGEYIPHWPHLKEVPDAISRYDCVPASAVEGVHFVAPDICNARHYYVVRAAGTRLWDEVYEDFADGRGEVSELEPNCFLSKEDRLTAVDRAALSGAVPSAPSADVDNYLRTNTRAFLGDDIDADC